MLSPGTYLSRRYEVVRRIGTGGMADVYKGKDHKLRRYVAIKVLKPEFAEDNSFVKKFQIEAQAAAGMLHPNVVNVYDVGADNGFNYMVMELVDGITLKEYIQKKGRLSDKEVISISIQMAAGLDAAHKKNIVHRDVKPQNVMISTEGKVKVTDFGIAKPTDATNTVSTNVMGSVHYTSPEQARGGSCDIQSDIYSAGITMYEMITGVVPFDGESTVAVAIKHLQEELTPASEYVPDMYYSLEQIINKCTQKNPSRRYVSMDALILDLKHSMMDPDGDFVRIGPLVYEVNNNVPSDEDDDYEADDYEDDDYEDDDYEDDDYEDDDYEDDDYEDDDDDYEDEEDDDGVIYIGGFAIDPKMQKVTKILTIVVAVIIAFSVLFIALKAMNFFSYGPGEDTEIEEELEDEIEEEVSDLIMVPSLVGLTETEAQELLNGMGLEYKKQSTEESGTYEAGYVIWQGVEEGEEVEENTIIYVIVSSGIAEETVILEDVVGESESSAQQTLNGQGVSMTSTTEYSDDVAQGTVISMNPSAGTEVAVGSSVAVTVSMGPEPAKKVDVPDIVGMTTTQAESALSSYGLVGSYTEQYDDTVTAGKVISQTTSAGTSVEEGTTVKYVVSKGPSPVEMPYVIEMTEAQAVWQLEDVGLKADVEYRYSSTIAEGVVISANKTYGTTLEAGTTVTIVVSLGPEVTEEPEEPEDTTDSSTTEDTTVE